MMDGRRFTRRAGLGALGGLATLWVGWSVSHAVDRWETAAARPAQAPSFPSWVSTTKRSRQAYELAFTNLELMATLPCYCGCAALTSPHASLRECFLQPSGRIEQHASGCGTCQDEAIDAVAWAGSGMSWTDVHNRIVASYSGLGPGSPGHRT